MIRAALSSCLLATTLAASALAAETPIVYMEPALVTTAPANIEHAAHDTYRRVTDPERIATYTRWLDNESAHRAFELYALAHRVAATRAATNTTASVTAAQPASQSAASRPAAPPPYYIALVPGGNHADLGFRLEDAGTVRDLATTPYIKLSADEWRFETTLLHETGHIVLAVLDAGNGLPRSNALASIPHTTAALSDRITAFDEGFAIHLETLAAHLNADPQSRERYHHQSFEFGLTPQKRGEYYRHGADLLSYSQNLARYQEVRDNVYSFAPACRDPDYLRTQLDKSRDYARVRSANQLVQCEGWHATVFFCWLVRGGGTPGADLLAQRQERMLTALADALQTAPIERDTPLLLRWVESHMRLYPDEAGELADVILDLSHGVLVDADAAALWREFYGAALRLDLKNLGMERIQAARERWRAAVLADPRVLQSRLGPQVRCEVPACTVKLVALGGERPLIFDINTAEEGVLRCVPGITDEEVGAWIAARDKQPFKGARDFESRASLSAAVRAALRIK